jgi:hypothetical protein
LTTVTNRPRPGHIAIAVVAAVVVVLILALGLGIKQRHDRDARLVAARLDLIDWTTYRASLQHLFDENQRLLKRFDALSRDADAASAARHDSHELAFKNKEARVEYLDVGQMQAVTDAEFANIHDLLNRVDERYGAALTSTARQHLREVETGRSDGIQDWSRAAEVIYEEMRAALNGRYLTPPIDLVAYYDRSSRELSHAETASAALSDDIGAIFRRIDTDVTRRRAALAQI